MTTHVFGTMGTVASIAFPAALPADGVLRSVESAFTRFDDVYSLYKPETPLSRIVRGELAMTNAPAEVLDAYSVALDWRELTDGSFTPHRPDGVLDLSGIVKAMAMSAAAEVLESARESDWCLNVGGDILVCGRLDGADWLVGIVDPDDRAELLTSVSLSGTRRACATSGSAERGDHIWTSWDGKSPFVQVSVVADDIVTADVLATAIVAGGAATLELATQSWPIDVLTVDRAGAIRMTPGMRAAMETARPR